MIWAEFIYVQAAIQLSTALEHAKPQTGRSATDMIADVWGVNSTVNRTEPIMPTKPVDDTGHKLQHTWARAVTRLFLCSTLDDAYRTHFEGIISEKERTHPQCTCADLIATYDFVRVPSSPDECPSLCTPDKYLAIIKERGVSVDDDIGPKRFESLIKEFSSRLDIRLVEGRFGRTLWILTRMRVSKGESGVERPDLAAVIGGIRRRARERVKRVRPADSVPPVLLIMIPHWRPDSVHSAHAVFVLFIEHLVIPVQCGCWRIPSSPAFLVLFSGMTVFTAFPPLRWVHRLTHPQPLAQQLQHCVCSAVRLPQELPLRDTDISTMLVFIRFACMTMLNCSMVDRPHRYRTRSFMVREPVFLTYRYLGSYKACSSFVLFYFSVGACHWHAHKT